MGRDVGFKFYYLDKDKRLIPANIIEGKNYINICGRCQATSLFADSICSFEPFGHDSVPDLVLNRPDLDNFEIDIEGYKTVLKYMSLDEFKSYFDFDTVEKEHNKKISDMENKICNAEQEISSLRMYQTKAETEIAFDKFEDRILDIKENIENMKEFLHELKEEDYEYYHYELIKSGIEEAEELLEKYPNLVVTAYWSE